MSWELPADPGTASRPSTRGTDWATAPGDDAAVVHTGPSGLVLGRSGERLVTLRLIAPQPRRMVLAVADYQRWLLIYRLAGMGCHLSLLSAPNSAPMRWTGLVDAVAAQGGSLSRLASLEYTPRAGRPYRASVLVDDAHLVPAQRPLGAWQSLVSVTELTADSSVLGLRSADVAVVGRLSGRPAENLRRAYALSARQARQVSELTDTEVMVATPRRAWKVTMIPTPSEHRLLFT